MLALVGMRVCVKKRRQNFWKKQESVHGKGIFLWDEMSSNIEDISSVVWLCGGGHNHFNSNSLSNYI